MDDLSDIIDDFAVPLTATRGAASTVTNGRAAPGATSTVPFNGTVTPATSKDLLRLPEGRRVEQTIRIITKTQLLQLPQADIVNYKGKQWEVQKADDWTDNGFYDCLAQLVNHT